MHQASILLYHTDPVEVRVLTGMLRVAGFRVLSTDSLTEAKLLLVTLPVDVLIIDLPAGESAPPALVTQVATRCPTVLRLMLVESERGELALRAMRQGLVHGLVRKPVRSTDIIAAVRLALTDPESLQLAAESTEPLEDGPSDESREVVNAQ